MRTLGVAHGRQISPHLPRKAVTARDTRSSHASLARTPLGRQPELTLGPACDRYEQEADHLADAVMHIPYSARGRGISQISATPGVLRSSSASPNPPAPAAVRDALRAAGQPLDLTTRRFMERRFGHDFSRVRVHTDACAAASAQAVGALAYTVGQNVVFGARQYAPHTFAGRRLLAHELAHVLQQGEQGSVLQRAIRFNPPSYTREDPVPKVLRNERILGLTTPTINGTQLPRNFNQGGQLINRALTPKKFRAAGATECAYDDFDVNISANIILPTRPVRHEWGPQYVPVSDLQGEPAAAAADRCQSRPNVPVAMLGTPDADAVANWVEGNEQEHLDDLRQIVDRILRPYFTWLMSLRGSGRTANECVKDLEGNFNQVSERGGWIDLLITQFLRVWQSSIVRRDAGGGHSVHTETTVKGACDRIEIKASTAH
jgi:Domain of unknown function (DUF4157)